MGRWYIGWLVVLVSIPTVGTRAQDAVAPVDPVGLSGFSESQTYEVDDKVPLTSENSFLARLLYRARRASDSSLRKYRQLGGNPGREDLLEDPRKNRFRVVEIEGQLDQLESFQVDGLGEEGNIYRTTWQTANGPVIVFLNEIPVACTTDRTTVR